MGRRHRAPAAAAGSSTKSELEAQESDDPSISSSDRKNTRSTGSSAHESERRTDVALLQQIHSLQSRMLQLQQECSKAGNSTPAVCRTHVLRNAEQFLNQLREDGARLESVKAKRNKGVPLSSDDHAWVADISSRYPRLRPWSYELQISNQGIEETLQERRAIVEDANQRTLPPAQHARVLARNTQSLALQLQRLKRALLNLLREPWIRRLLAGVALIGIVTWASSYFVSHATSLAREVVQMAATIDRSIVLVHAVSTIVGTSIAVGLGFLAGGTYGALLSHFLPAAVGLAIGTIPATVVGATAGAYVAYTNFAV